MKKIKKFFLISFNKIKTIYKKAYNKTPYTEPIVVITTSLAIVLALILCVNKAMSVSTSSIANNKGEESYFASDYESALKENDLLQETDEWPIYMVKNAEIYSIQGDYKKSNSLLANAVEKRDNLVEANGREKYVKEDIELMNYIIFTYFVNGEYEQAISLGEDYINKYGKVNDIMKTVFTVYLTNGEKDKAVEILNEYSVDANSSYDEAIYAEMNGLVNNTDKALSQLEKAWNLNKSEMKIIEVLENLYHLDKDALVSKLEANAENSNFYKVCLAKIYSLSEETAQKSIDIISKLDSNDLSSLNVEMINVEALKKVGKTKEAEERLQKIINNDENKFYGYHVAAIDALNNKEYDKAIEYSKLSILENGQYADNYIYTIPESLTESGKVTEAYPYLRTGLRLEPFSYDTMVKIGDYYAKGKNYKEAQKFYNLALNINNNDSELYSKVSNFYKEDNNIEEAIKYIKKALELDENNIDFLRTLGALQMKAENNEEGIEFTRKAYALNNSDPLVLNNAAVYYFKVESDFERGMINMEAAYNNRDSIKDLEIKKELLSNYNWAKTLYDKYKNSGVTSTEIPDFTIFY